MTFTGFPAEAVEFYQRLEMDNSKEFWAANADLYTSAVKEPMAALLAELETEFGAPKVFRPYRDARFSKDKSPYKTHQGAYVPSGTATGWYVQIGPEGLFVGGGIYQAATDQLARYRANVDAERSGSALEKLLDGLRAKGFEVAGEQLASKPRGYQADHPRIDLLRHKALVVQRSYGEPDWLSTRRAASVVRDDWRAMRPLMEWLIAYVGSSENEPRRPGQRG